MTATVVNSPTTARTHGLRVLTPPLYGAVQPVCVERILDSGIAIASKRRGASSQLLRVHLLDALERRQLLNGFPALLFGQSDVVEVLKVEPELWARSEKMSQA